MRHISDSPDLETSSLTDSPWFWVLIFSLMSLGALVAISGKYGRRQTVIERKYQARERVADRLGKQSNENQPANASRFDSQQQRRDFVTPGDTLIPLWPLAMILVTLAAFAAAMLYRGRGRPGSHAVGTSLP